MHGTAAPRILITRAPHQASALADAVRSVGAEPILIPTIDIVEPASFEALDGAVARLDNFHWLIFTSANAVTAFDRRRKMSVGHMARFATDRGPAVPSKVAAIGSATAAALNAIYIAPDVVPSQAVAESLAEALLPYALQPDGTPTRFLLVRAEEAREHLPEALRAAGGVVLIAPAYRNVVPSTSINALSDLFRMNPPDAIILTSSSTAQNLFRLLEAASLAIPTTSGLITFGPITSATVREHGFSVAAEAAESSIPSLLESLVRYLESRCTA